jgi:hypothetical protein
VVTEAELPTKVLSPAPWKRASFSHHTVDELLLSSDRLDEFFADTDLAPRRGVRLWWHLDASDGAWPAAEHLHPGMSPTTWWPYRPPRHGAGRRWRC